MNLLSKYALMLPLLATALLIGGCGIKPKNLEPPSGTANTTFPKTYPAPDTH